MRKKILLKNAWAMALFMVMGIAVSACSNDDEPAVLEGVKADASSFQLNEDGEVTVEFTVSPANASVDNVTLLGNDAFQLVGKTSAGNGKWIVSMKATDFAKVGASNDVTLQVAQPGGIQKEVSFKVEDPYSIIGKFGLDHPRGFNYYGIEQGHTYDPGLPVVVSAEKSSDLSMISDIKIINGVTSQKVGVEYFVAVKIENRQKGVVLKVNPEKLAELKKLVPTYTTLDFVVVLTSDNGRVANLPLSAMTCAPETSPVVDDQLTVTAAQIMNPDFDKTVRIDLTTKLRHIGVMGMNPGDGNVRIEGVGLFNEAGEKVEQQSLIALIAPDSQGNMTCDFTFIGDDEYILKPGNYTYVQGFHVDYIYGGVKYETVCAELKYQFVIK